MKMGSDGLGKIELEFDASSTEIRKKEKELQVIGVTDAPVQWEFEITVEKDDFIGLFHLILSRNMLSFLKTNIKLVFTSLFSNKSSEKNQLKEEGVK